MSVNGSTTSAQILHRTGLHSNCRPKHGDNNDRPNSDLRRGNWHDEVRSHRDGDWLGRN